MVDGPEIRETRDKVRRVTFRVRSVQSETSDLVGQNGRRKGNGIQHDGTAFTRSTADREPSA